MSSLVIRNAQVWADGRFFHGGVRSEDGVIVALEASGTTTPADEVIDAGGALVLPGAVDLHVHFRDPGKPHKEDFTSGSHAAALGGVTTVLDMPNTTPAVLDAGALAVKRAALEGRSFVDFGLIAAADPSNADEIDGLAAAGAAAFKLFTYERRDAPPAGILDDATLLSLLQAVAAVGLRAHVHAENDSLVKAGRRAESGSQDWAAHLRSRAPLVEEEAVMRTLLFARDAGAHLHVCHLSSARALARILHARAAGQSVTCEVTPQHVLLDDAGYGERGADLIMVPPVRTTGDRSALHSALVGGDIDVVATDHAPHTSEDKIGAPLAISTGLVGVQWSYPLLLTEALAGRMPLARVIDAMATRPGGMLGATTRKGVIRPGAAADLVVVETTRDVLDRRALASRGRSTPFDGTPVRCRIRDTVVGGRVQVADGVLVGAPTGRFISPSSEYRKA
ncbi:dihydroorotase family protein [Microbacterium koreense]|uniref:Dihydroorotase family protein n=1 Tax=Microbacterium koreense TaxID=323761 RepID=A0ABW2ZMM4_9MICO